MSNVFDQYSIEELRDILLSVKNAYAKMEAMVIADPDSLPPAQINSTMQLAVIEQAERAVRGKGMDPSDPYFGQDIIGEIISRRLNGLQGR